MLHLQCIRDSYKLSKLVKSFLTGRLVQILLRRLHQTTDFHTTQFHLSIQSVRITVTSQVKHSLAQNVVKKQKFTQELPVTIVLLKTGMMVKHRNTKTEKFMMLLNQHLLMMLLKTKFVNVQKK